MNIQIFPTWPIPNGESASYAAFSKSNKCAQVQINPNGLYDGAIFVVVQFDLADLLSGHSNLPLALQFVQQGGLL